MDGSGPRRQQGLERRAVLQEEWTLRDLRNRDALTRGERVAASGMSRLDVREEVQEWLVEALLRLDARRRKGSWLPAEAAISTAGMSARSPAMDDP